ncbi:MAG: cytochrome c maturation protein CcmE [Hyphomicrobiaceae bacterium]|nr:cytochrome c maturation protein CcmE [Hyphomicrobiaceae bacterium]
MTRKQRRSTMIFGGLGVLALAIGLALSGLSGNITFFYSPSDLVEQNVKPGQRIRLGGLVEEGSVIRGQSIRIKFKVTDNAKNVNVVFEGVLPDLFREGQGVVTEGMLDTNGVFIADTVLAKHDENYMPPEVAATLKKKGMWTKKDTETVKGAGS